jgi:hypothetical protein
MLRFTGLKLNKSEKQLLSEVAKFTLNKFIPKSTQKKMYVNIKITEGFDRGWQGQCEYLGNKNNIRKFDVIVSLKGINKQAKDLNKKLREPIKTMIHEMVHVKQYVNNQLFDYIDGNTKFEGKVYKDAKTYTDYWDMPWEIEAYGRTEGIYQQFLINQKKMKLARKKK